MTRPPSPPSSSPFGSLGSRFGASKIIISTTPVADTLVHFELEGLGDALFRLLNAQRRRKDGTELDAAMQIFEEDARVTTHVSEQLNAAWSSYGVRGAVLLYTWRDEVKQSVASETGEDASSASFLRVRDPLLVLNVLARTRANLLLAHAPLAFERAFLERSLIADDARLVKLAYEKGYVKETISVPRPKNGPTRPGLPQR